MLRLIPHMLTQPALTLPQGASPVFRSDDVSWQRSTTEEAPYGQRFKRWLEMLRTNYAQLEVETDSEVEEVHGEIVTRCFGSVILSEVKTVPQRIRRTPPSIASGPQDGLLVHYQCAGSTIVRQDGRETRVLGNDIVVYDCARPYELLCGGDDHQALVVRHPRALLLQHVRGLEGLTATVLPPEALSVQLLRSMLSSAIAHGKPASPLEAADIGGVITTLVAAGLRELPGDDPRKGSKIAAYHITRVKDFVDQHLHEPDLSVEAIALAMKISSDHLCRLFRNDAMPLSRWIAQRRLEACRRDLVDPRMASRSVSDIAFSSGFSDAANFSRAFREQFGVSPRELRQSAVQPRTNA